jgi:hypothetical protein
MSGLLKYKKLDICLNDVEYDMFKYKNWNQTSSSSGELKLLKK